LRSFCTSSVIILTMIDRPAGGATGSPAHTFLVRLWHDRARGEWLGQVTHIQTGHRQAFRHLRELQAFLEAAVPGVGGDASSAPGGPKGPARADSSERPDQRPEDKT
jgi:hypothetical protein